MLIRLVRLSCALMLTLAGMVAISADVTVAVASDRCTGQASTHIVEWYSVEPPFRRAPLRCGTSSYGYNHIKSRFGQYPLFEANIQNTLQYPGSWTTSGTSVTFDAFAQGCGPQPYFRVVVEYANYSDGNPKGIITAYYSSVAPTNAAARYAAARLTSAAC